MSKIAFAAAFAAGLAVLAWTAFGFVGASWLPLLVTAMVAGVYLLGAWELRQFRAATLGLRTALEGLAQAPARLADWLERVPASLRESVRLRVEGERAVLPGPALTPFLVGLLVMLGMLGTFLGMVVTFKGAVFVLEGSTDLQAIRAALAEPIKGLGLSFGTSVAGVAASAMLGLMSAIARRERLLAARELDRRIATTLQPFSLAHQRQAAFEALQAQSRALPDVAATLQAMMERMEERSRALDEQLLARQERFQREVTCAYGALAEKVGQSLQESLAIGTRAAGEAVRPVVEATMQQVVTEAQRLHRQLEGVAQAQLEGEARLARQHGERLDQLTATWRTELAALRTQEEQRGAAAVGRLGELQGAVAQHLADLGSALEAPISRLLHTASEVPQAAAGVIGELRQEMSRLAERDNVALQERTQLLEQLRTLMQSLQDAAAQQRAASEALLASADHSLKEAGTGFAQVLDAHAGKAGEVAEQVAGSAAAMAGLAEGFQQGVQQFQASNDKLVASLERVEASLTRSTARSDEQLAYYVAQAREVIDLSIASQQGLVEQLRQAQSRPARAAAVTEGAGA